MLYAIQIRKGESLHFIEHKVAITNYNMFSNSTIIGDTYCLVPPLPINKEGTKTEVPLEKP